MVKLLSEAAPAKINLFLRVVGRRPDGYHELDSIFLPIDLCDRVRVELRPSVRRTVTLSGNFGDLPADDRNLAVKAAKRFMATFDLNAAVLIGLDKTIPHGAGLGGGSSDAAAVLRMMAAMTRLDAPARLARLAVEIGADVPFFLDPRPARVSGIGELIAPLSGFLAWPIVVAVPPVEVPTAVVFRDLKPAHWSGRARDDDVAALMTGDLPPGLFVNDLAAAAIDRFPAIGALQRMIKETGARVTAMSGSGGAVFGLFDSIAQADIVANELRRRDPQLRVFAVQPWYGQQPRPTSDGPGDVDKSDSL
jgi:4-diphosphocytidyl-2-C-methyl-D-erythritol kinase